jgi:hypothetical protein
MKTFKQFTNEGFVDKALGTALTFGALGVGTAGLKMMSGEQQQIETQPHIQQPIPQQPSTIKAEEKPKEENKQPTAHDNFHTGLQKKFGNEYGVILNAAKRNGISETDHDSLAMLFAIRKTENGKHGKQFGVLHKNAYAKQGETSSQSLDRQAGWAASILNKRKNEWSSMPVNEQSKYQGFHHYLQTKYAPHGVKNDPTGLNKNWLNNFKTHYNEHIGFLQ